MGKECLVSIEPDSPSMTMINHRGPMPLIIKQKQPLERIQNTASKKQELSTLIAISTGQRRERPPDTLTTLKLRTIAIAPTGRTTMESPKNLLTVWLKTACSITASGEGMSNSNDVPSSLKSGTKKSQLLQQ